VTIFLKIRGLMVSYLKSVEKHAFDIPYIDFKLYSNIVVPSWVDLDPLSKERGDGSRFQVFEEGIGDMSIIP
jgi:hypothetical protein